MKEYIQSLIEQDREDIKYSIAMGDKAYLREKIERILLKNGYVVSSDELERIVDAYTQKGLL